MNVYIDNIEDKYLEETLTFCGIINPMNAPFTVVGNAKEPKFPYIKIQEGCLFTDKTLYTILDRPLGWNVFVSVNGKVVFEQRLSNDYPVTHIDNPIDYLDLYNANNRETLKEKLQEFEPLVKERVYYKNTEKYFKLEGDYDRLVGLASGTMMARWAYENNIKDIEFYDYSPVSLKFQKELIQADDINEVYDRFLPVLHTGKRSATVEDIKQIDIETVQKYYNFLKDCNVEYGLCDIRREDDLERLLYNCNERTAVWLSNVYYYVGSLNTNKEPLFKILDSSSAVILPYTRANYES